MSIDLLHACKPYKQIINKTVLTMATMFRSKCIGFFSLKVASDGPSPAPATPQLSERLLSDRPARNKTTKYNVYVCMYVCLSVRPSVRPFVGRSVGRPVGLYVCIFSKGSFVSAWVSAVLACCSCGKQLGCRRRCWHWFSCPRRSPLSTSMVSSVELSSSPLSPSCRSGFGVSSHCRLTVP